MQISKNGRVVIVDDQVEEEGLPLIRALTKNNVPSIYFTGKIEDLPTKPLSGIRIIFLDIILGTDGQPAKTQIATAANVLKKIIDKNNGPYLLLAWTNHEEHISGIKAAIRDMPPACFMNLEKGKCKDSTGNFSIDKIDKKIRSELNKVSTFHLFTIWEDLVHKAAGKVVNDFSALYNMDDQWDKQASAVFFQLAKACAGGKTEAMKNKEVVTKALLSFNGVFADTLEALIRSSKDTSINLCSGILKEEIKGKINQKLLLIAGDDLIHPEPGNLYEISKKFGKKLELQEFFDGNFDTYPEKTDLDAKTRHCFLEVSPSCDFVQDKWKVHRCLPGVMWPYVHNKKLKKTDFTYKSPLFEIDNALYTLVFDMRYLTSLPIGKLKNKKVLLRLRHDFLVDIQSHLARHINRPGIISLQ